MSTPSITSTPRIAQDATAIVHVAIETATAGDEDRLAECVHAMLANPIRAALCMWTLLHTSQSLLEHIAQGQHTAAAQVWATLAPSLAEAELARAVAAAQPETVLAGGR